MRTRLSAPRSVAFALALGLGGACGGAEDNQPDAPTDIPPGEDSTRDILSTELSMDLATQIASARITLGPSDSRAASFEIGDLEIMSVSLVGDALQFADQGDRLDIGVPASTTPVVLDIAYHFNFHNGFMGVDDDGFTLTWPYYCGNMFPCRSNPSDGTTFTLELTGVADGSVAVYPTSIPTDAPSYQVAWAIGDYQELDVGTTTAGTHIAMWHRPNEMERAVAGSANLRDAFDWLEQTIGPYRFGPEAGGVGVTWGPGALGGMEHHPMWHVASGVLDSEEVNVHEAAHGWYGDGIRIACWEDFVLSEGTVTYLAGRALDVVAPTVGAETWEAYESELGGISPTDPVWPTTCNEIDILDDNLFTNAPYMRGAFFYRAVALRVGADVLDGALNAFYMQYAGQAARMTDMLRVIQEETGFDATSCANSWLRSTTIPAIGACP
jgi:aminopeptidase N